MNNQKEFIDAVKKDLKIMPPREIIKKYKLTSSYMKNMRKNMGKGE